MSALLLALALARPAGAAPPQFLSAGVAAAADKFALTANDARRPLTARDLPNAALAELALGRGPVRAESYLSALFAAQDMDPSSRGYGTVPWQLRGKAVADANAIEFSMQAVGPLFLRYGTKLDRGYYGTALPHLTAAVAAIERHDVKVSYTNIFLMKSVNLILLGQVLVDERITREGEELLDRWLAYTRTNGIGEYDSPTYYKVDVNDLEYGLLYAVNPAVKEKCRAALDYLWTDVAANYFSGRRSLSGAHSRDYDFLEGRGGLDVFFAAYGWNAPPEKFSELDLESVALLQSELDGGYRPPENLRAVRESAERLVLSRWGPEPGQERVNYLTRDFAIGAAGRDSGPQDKTLSIQLDAPGRFPDITVVADDSGEPYGKKKVEGKDGHSKPRHLASRPVAVQDRGLLLAAYDAGADKNRPGRELALNVILPAAAMISIDGATVRLNAPARAALAPGAVVSVSAGAALVLIRVVSAASCSGETPVLELSADEGLRWGAARLRVAVSGRCRLRAAFLFQALSAASDADRRAALDAFRGAAVSETFAGGLWTLEADAAGGRLRLQRDLSAKTILSRTVNGREAAFDALSVNGVPVYLGGSGGPRTP